MFVRFLKDKKGATAVEYGLIAAVLSIVIIGGVGMVATELKDLWGSNDGEIAKGLNGG